MGGKRGRPFRHSLSRRALLQFLEDFRLGGKAAFVVFGEDFLAVDRDDEDAAASPDDLRFDAQFFFDLSRQTGGSGEVVSNAAVVDSNVHGEPGFLE